MADALDQVLRLVAEGRLSAAEAEPILAALAGGGVADAPEPAGRPAATPSDDESTAGRRRGRVARIQVSEGGRSSVDLRIPLSLGRFGLSSIPGLSGTIAERLREAVDQGETGPILEVADEDGDGVRIVIE